MIKNYIRIMTTALAHAFAKLQGVTLPATFPEEDNKDPRCISVLIAKQRFSIRQLMDGVPLPIGDIDVDILQKAIPWLNPGNRQYIEQEGNLFFQKPQRPGEKQKKPKLIERLGYESDTHELVRKVDRELVAVLKGEKDLFTTEAGMIQYIRNLLLRLLADARTRTILQQERDSAFIIIGRINDALEKKRADPGLESALRSYYDRITTLLGFSPLDHQIIRALSWEWKDRPIYRDHPFACRCWVLIPSIFGLTKSI